MLSINTRPSPHSQNDRVSIAKSRLKHETTILSEVLDQRPIQQPKEDVAKCRMRKTKSGSLNPDSMSSFSPPQFSEEGSSFANSVRRQTNAAADIIKFNRGLRDVMEPHLRRARLKREMSRDRTQLNVDASIASSVGVPYACLRKEKRFLFDEHTHPLHQVLCDTLGTKDLSSIHELKVDKRSLLRPILDKKKRQRFHECYDSFVTSFCIPLLHATGMSKNIFHTTSYEASNRITYRYQAFPTIQIVCPGDDPYVEPRCASADGHSIGCLTFHIPLSPSYGTNAMYVESHPGREDWHPLTTKSVGLGYLFDGARCLHFDLENTTETTRVSLNFNVIIYRERDCVIPTSNGLCSIDCLEDNFSREGSGYYEEATIDLGINGSSALNMVAKKHCCRWNVLLDPDHRNGFPFT